eukprot:gene10190-biopygen13829
MFTTWNAVDNVAPGGRAAEKTWTGILYGVSFNVEFMSDGLGRALKMGGCLLLGYDLLNGGRGNTVRSSGHRTWTPRGCAADRAAVGRTIGSGVVLSWAASASLVRYQKTVPAARGNVEDKIAFPGPIVLMGTEGSGFGNPEAFHDHPETSRATENISRQHKRRRAATKETSMNAQ